MVTNRIQPAYIIIYIKQVNISAGGNEHEAKVFFYYRSDSDTGTAWL